MTGRQLRARLKLIGALAVAILVAVMSFPHVSDAIGLGSNDPGVETMNLSGDIPPAYAGNRAAYAFALASLFAMSTLAIRWLFVLKCQLAEEHWSVEPDVGLFRIATGLLLCVILLGASPDVVLLMLWGEVTFETLSLFMTVDRIGDGMTIFPFLGAIAVLVRVDQIKRQPEGRLEAFLKAQKRLSARHQFFAIMPRRDGARDTVRLVVGVLVIAFGLALFK